MNNENLIAAFTEMETDALVTMAGALAETLGQENQVSKSSYQTLEELFEIVRGTVEERISNQEFWARINGDIARL